MKKRFFLKSHSCHVFFFFLIIIFFCFKQILPRENFSNVFCQFREKKNNNSFVISIAIIAVLPSQWENCWNEWRRSATERNWFYLFIFSCLCVLIDFSCPPHKKTKESSIFPPPILIQFCSQFGTVYFSTTLAMTSLKVENDEIIKKTNGEKKKIIFNSLKFFFVQPVNLVSATHGPRDLIS